MNMINKYTRRQAQHDLPQRLKNDNKTRGGKTLVIAGSAGQWGAGIHCATACARIGAGYTYLFDSDKNFPAASHPDFLIIQKLTKLSQFRSIALGPGFSNHRLLKKIIFQLAKDKYKNVVIDAEGLNLLSKLKKWPVLPNSWILTPHEGELSRLLNISAESIRKNRLKSVQMIQKKTGCIILLKGHKTLIADQKSVFEIQAGNPALAKAGTGDVLTGLIAGLLSQQLNPMNAACLGAFIHGYIADQWVKSGYDELSLLASDLNSNLPASIFKLRQKVSSGRSLFSIKSSPIAQR